MTGNGRTPGVDQPETEKPRRRRECLCDGLEGIIPAVSHGGVQECGALNGMPSLLRSHSPVQLHPPPSLHLDTTHSPTMPQQNWKLCPKCATLFFAGDALCPSPTNSGIHDLSHSAMYTISSSPSSPGQSGWCRCSRCQVLSFTDTDTSTTGPCQAGGQHDVSSSGDYHLPHFRGRADALAAMQQMPWPRLGGDGPVRGGRHPRLRWQRCVQRVHERQSAGAGGGTGQVALVRGVRTSLF